MHGWLDFGDHQEVFTNVNHQRTLYRGSGGEGNEINVYRCAPIGGTGNKEWGAGNERLLTDLNSHISYTQLPNLLKLATTLFVVVKNKENVVTDRQTDWHTYRTTTVTLAAHARWGLIIWPYGHTVWSRNVGWLLAITVSYWAIYSKQLTSMFSEI